MRYIILVGHGFSAEGLLSAILMMTGEREDICGINLEHGMDIDKFVETFNLKTEHLSKNDEILLFSDIMGGAPLTSALQALAERGLMEVTTPFAGMNMPMVLTAALLKDRATINDIKFEVVKEGRAGLNEFILNSSKTSLEII